MTKTTVEVLRGITPGFRLAGQVYIKVELGVRYPDGGDVTLGQIGKDLVVQPQRILKALLSDHRQLRAVNDAAFNELFERNHRITELTYEDRPVLARSEKRDHLEHLAVGVRAFEGSKHSKTRERRPYYYDWALSPKRIVAVPLSEGMVDVIEKSRRWTAIALEIEAFEKQLDDLADAVVGLRGALKDLARVGQAGVQDVAMLAGLSQYCELLLDQQGNPERGESPLADFREFLLPSALPNFMRRIVCNPVDLAPEAAKERDRYTRKIMKILDDPDFIAGVELVAANHDIVPHELFDNLTYYMTAANDLISITDRADEFADKHALPVMEALTKLPSKEYEEDIQLINNPELRDAMAEGGGRGVLPERRTAYKAIGGLGAGILGSVSNLEGPRSVVVAVMMQYHVHLFRKAAQAATKPGVVYAAAFHDAVNKFDRHFARPTGFVGHSDSARALFHRRLMKAVAKGEELDFLKFAKEAGYGMTRGPFRSATARSTMLLVAIATAALAIAGGDDTFASSLSVTAGLGTVGIATLDFPPIANALEGRWGSMAKLSGRLAGLVGVIGIGSSLVGLFNAVEDGDDLGIVEGILGTLGSSASFLGWALSLKYGALAFAPSLLMTAGSVLLVGGIALTLWRTMSPQQPRDIVNGTLESFLEPDSRAAISALQPTVETLIDLARSVDFEPLHPTYHEALRAMGFDADTVTVLGGMA